MNKKKLNLSVTDDLKYRKIFAIKIMKGIMKWLILSALLFVITSVKKITLLVLYFASNYYNSMYAISYIRLQLQEQRALIGFQRTDSDKLEPWPRG